MACPPASSPPASQPSRPARPPTVLDDLPLYLPRVFYAFLGVVERKLEETQLSKHLQPGMGHVLLRLYEGDNCIIKDISHSTHIANGTLTGLLKRMEKGGLVTCRRCSEDGRAVRVSLTTLGRSLEPRIRDFHRQIIAIVEEGLTPKEVVVAKGLLAHILHSLRMAEESMRPDPKKPLPKAPRRPGGTKDSSRGAERSDTPGTRPPHGRTPERVPEPLSFTHGSRKPSRPAAHGRRKPKPKP